jgi:hypothetical protein
MRRAEREALRARYQRQCGYCGTTEIDAGGELTVDHFQPQTKGGADTPENWVYACIRCNDYKGDYWQPGSVARILHPLLDDLAVHLCESEDGHLIALTETGRFHIDHLQLNRPQLIRQRECRRQFQALQERSEKLKQENADLRRELQRAEEQARWLMEEARQEIEP